MSGPRIAVVGAGVAGLAAATALRRRLPAGEVVVLEASQRVGGLVESERTPDGFVLEHGADCLVTTQPEGIDAAVDAGLRDAIVAGRGGRTFVALGSALVPLPPVFAGWGAEVALSMLRTPLLSLPAKARSALEPLVRARRDHGDESVAEFVGRRFGADLARVVVSPLVGGIYGDDTRRLSAEACLPRLRALERAHGSVLLGIRSAVRARRRRERAGERVPPPTVTLLGGMASLPEAQARRLGASVELGVEVRRISRGAGRSFRIETARGDLTCEGVIVATPAWRAPALVEEISPDLAAELAAIAHKRLDCVALAWRREQIPHALDATGWVRGAGDRRATLACSWASRKWPGRAPDGSALVRSVLALPDADESELVAAARADLRDLIGVDAAPLLVRARRLARATPIYEVGHPARAARIAAQAADLGGIAIAGNALYGIGVPACVASGERAAAAALAELRAA